MVKLLIVEDEIIVAKDLEKQLEDLGYSIVGIESTGEDAIKTAGKKKPDIVLMDIKLAGEIDGIEAAEKIKKEFNIPIVYITAYGDKDTLKRAKISEPYGYILKPFEVREVQSNIEMALYKHRVEKELSKYRMHLEELVRERTNNLAKTNLKLKAEIKNRKKLEEINKRTKEYLENIINSASEIIFSFDKKSKIRLWNKSSELLTGFTQKEVVGKTINQTSIFDDNVDISDTLLDILLGKKPVYNELILKSKNKEKRVLQISYSPIINEEEEINGVLFIGNDITSISEKYGRLIPGRSYFIIEEDNTVAMKLFADITKIDKKGLLITRTPIDRVKDIVSSNDCDLILLSQANISSFPHILNPEEVVKKVEDYSKKNKDTIILLDGVHFLLSKFSFDEFINMIFQIRDIVSINKSIFLLNFDPALLDKRQLTVIKDEMQPMPNKQLDDIILPEELYKILYYIHNQNQNNILISIKDISNHFSIVYRTAAKRLEVLESKGLIHVRKYGRIKALYVTEKGKLLVSKKS